MNGLFISFEGIDGAGKSTHIDRLAQTFRAAGRSVWPTREPGGTPLAEQLRQMVLHTPMDTVTETLLVWAARRDHLQHAIRPALARGEVVLCDRFSDATFAYQGGGRGLDWELLARLECWVQSDAAPPAPLLAPDLTLWFDLPAAVAAQRLDAARTPDKFEAQSTAFFERVAAGYARRAAQQPARFVRIDADQAPEAVWQQIAAAVRAKGLLP